MDLGPGRLAEADIYLIAVSDRAVAGSGRFAAHSRGASWPTPPGSVPLEALPDRPTTRRAVFYPLQTFTKGREVDFSQIPVFLETDDEALRPELEAFARRLSRTVIWADSACGQKRISRRFSPAISSITCTPSQSASPAVRDFRSTCSSR